MIDKIVLLYSGGLDSTLLIHLAKSMGLDVLCLGVNYGQKHAHELEKASKICQTLDLEYMELKIQLPVESKLTGNLTTEYSDVSEWYVPSRNLIFVSLAASMAESKGIDTIWIGANYADRVNLFPDCYQEWIVGVNELLKRNGSIHIQVEAPLLGFTKERTQQLAKYFGIKDEEVHSGYGK
jgi:7-cyano-7-deazaguanine synthase